jgi:hypothetical protein
MHPYLPHLLADITAATRPDIPWEFEETTSFEEEMEDIENWVAGTLPSHTFSYWCGLKAEEFPPAEQLTDEDMRMVCKAFRHLLFSWNLGIELPENLPPATRYAFMVNTLNEETAIPKSGFMDFDYCSGNAPDCVFKEYCPCLKYWNEPGHNYIPGNSDDNNSAGISDDEELPF